jgi:hypothetical protein
MNILFLVTITLLPVSSGTFVKSLIGNETQYDERRTMKSDCLGPPYLYISLHHEVPNILKYSRDGCLLSETVLKGGHIDTKSNPLFTEFRSIMIGAYKGAEALYVALATTGDSAIMVYGACSPDDHGQREYLGTVVDTKHNAGADHTYGLTTDEGGNIYGSFQHTDVVLRFNKDSFEPMAFPPMLNEVRKQYQYYPGTFYQFGAAGPHISSQQGVRSIAFVNGDLWIANEDVGGIAVVDVSTGQISNVVIVHNPIGMYYDKSSNRVFVGSKKGHWGGAVLAIDPVRMKVVAKYTTNRMNHPAGITSHGDDLYVVEQELGHVYKFSISTTEYLKKVFETEFQPEQIIMSYC